MGGFEAFRDRLGKIVQPNVYRGRERGYELVQWRELSFTEWESLGKSLLGFACAAATVANSPVALSAFFSFVAANRLSIAFSGKTLRENYRSFRQRNNNLGREQSKARSYQNATENFEMMGCFGGKEIRVRDRRLPVDAPVSDTVTVQIQQKGSPKMEITARRPAAWTYTFGNRATNPRDARWRSVPLR